MKVCANFVWHGLFCARAWLQALAALTPIRAHAIVRVRVRLVFLPRVSVCLCFVCVRVLCQAHGLTVWMSHTETDTDQGGFKGLGAVGGE